MAKLRLHAVGLLCLCAANAARAPRSLRLEATSPRPSLLFRDAAQLKTEHEDRGDGLESPESSNSSGVVSLSLPAPGQVQADFVRRCAVALSVRSRELLPVNVLDEFCRLTNAVVECQQQLVMKLKAVHAERGSIPAFCADAYRWFQTKYGMLCPMQCQKLQCRAACQWLEEKKLVDDQAKELKAYDMEVVLAEDELEDATKAVADAQEKLTLNTRALNQSIILINRTQERLAEQQVYVELAAGKVENATAQIRSMEEAREDFTNELRAQYARLQSVQFEREWAGLSQQRLEKQIQGLTKDINEKVDGLKVMQREIARGNRSSQERWKALQSLMDSASSLTNVSEAQEVRVRDASKALDGARSQLKDAQANGSPSESNLKLMNDFVEQQKAKLFEEELILNKTEHYRGMLAAELKRSSAELNVLDSELQDLVNRTMAKADEVSGLVAELHEAEDATRALGNGNLSALRTQIRDVRGTIAILTEGYINVVRTISLTRESQAKDTRDLEHQQERAQLFRKALQEAEVQKENANHSIELAEEALGQANATETALRTKFQEMNAALSTRQKASREARNQLNRLAPDIVTQHGLGLLEVLATW